jgi:hypothetical protein
MQYRKAHGCEQLILGDLMLIQAQIIAEETS